MKRRTPLTALAVSAAILVLTGCVAVRQPASDAAPPPTIEHIHAIGADARGEGFLLATHRGVFTLTPDGTLYGPVGGHDFDAMGFVVRDGVLFASGHPGPRTSPALGAPNLGLIRSDDVAGTWTPISLTGSVDFHALAAGADGILYGLASDGVEVLISEDDGVTWVAGATLSAVDLAAVGDDLYATGEEGLSVSTDRGRTFAPLADAPSLYVLDGAPDGTLAGVGVDGALWVKEANAAWMRKGALDGVVSAFTALGGDRFILVDDRGVVTIAGDEQNVLAPLR